MKVFRQFLYEGSSHKRLRSLGTAVVNLYLWDYIVITAVVVVVVTPFHDFYLISLKAVSFAEVFVAEVSRGTSWTSVVAVGEDNISGRVDEQSSKLSTGAVRCSGKNETLLDSDSHMFGFHEMLAGYR